MSSPDRPDSSDPAAAGPNRAEAVRALFHQALELRAEERLQFLDRGCGDDEELRSQVESLLAAAEAATQFLECGPERPPTIDLPAGSGERRGALLVGQPVGRYVVERLLGAGGMGVVYLARDTELGRLVALKVLSVERREDEGARARFRREAKAAARLDQPNIGTVYEVGEHAGHPYIAMAFYEAPNQHSCHAPPRDPQTIGPSDVVANGDSHRLGPTDRHRLST